MSTPTDSTAIERWLRQLDEPLLLAWANRGLLRRAQGVLSQVQAGSNPHGFDCSLEAQTQHLRGPGFQHLRCTCPAAGACHHAVAALLFWSAQLADTPPAPAASEGEDAASSHPFWRATEGEDIVAAFPSASLRRAAQWLDEGLGLAFDEDARRLQARLASGEAVSFGAAGVDDSVCSCDRPRCAHRVFALLAWRRLHAFNDAPLPAPARPPREQRAVREVETCLVDLAVHGLGALSADWIQALLALALRCQQAELPALAADLRGLAQAAEDEHARRRSADPQALPRSLAHCWARCRALQAPFSPQARIELRGRHRRDYLPAPPLQLQVLGFECWRGLEDRAGASVHAWCQRSRRWWRLAAINTGPGLLAQEAERLRWGGLGLDALLGRGFTVSDALASADGSLRLRSGLATEQPEHASMTAEPNANAGTPDPVETPAPDDALLSLADAQRRWYAARPPGLLNASPEVRMIGSLRLAPVPDRDGRLFAFESTQTGTDSALELRFDPRSPEQMRARGCLLGLQQAGLGEVHLLGWFDSLQGQPRLQPLSLWCLQRVRWLHLHAERMPALEHRAQANGVAPWASAAAAAGESSRAAIGCLSAEASRAHRSLIQALNDTRNLLSQRLGSGCAHSDPGFVLGLKRWMAQGLGKHWPQLLAGLDPQATPSLQARALLNAMLRSALAIEIEAARPWLAQASPQPTEQVPYSSPSASSTASP